MTRRAAWVLPVVLLLASACGTKRFAPPTGPGTPFPEFAAALDEATRECRGIKTLNATLALSGRAGSQKLRGRVDAGFSEPGAARLEGRAPFGRPVFILVARSDSSAMLVLPRDSRVLREAPPAAIVEALTGVALGPDDLRSAIAGCGFGAAAPSSGRAYGDWVATESPGMTHYLKRNGGRWRLMASTRGPLTIEYGDFQSWRPATIRMRAAGPAGAAQTDLGVKVSDVEANVPLHPDFFEVEVPDRAEPLTLEELRRAGPLGAPATR